MNPDQILTIELNALALVVTGCALYMIPPLWLMATNFGEKCKWWSWPLMVTTGSVWVVTFPAILLFLVIKRARRRRRDDRRHNEYMAARGMGR